MRSNELVTYWRENNIIKDEKLLEVFSEINRRLFVPDEFADQAYEDHPLPIGEGQTISQPTTVMIMTQALEVKPGMNVLEIGSGSGYQAAILAQLVGPEGHVFSIERLIFLVTLARKNLERTKITNVRIIEGDGTLGYPSQSPFDRIIITAAAPSIPQPIFDQLKEGGQMVVPIGDRHTQEMMIVEKINGKLKQQSIGSFVFVPLIGKFGFKDASS